MNKFIPKSEGRIKARESLTWKISATGQNPVKEEKSFL